MSKLATSNKVYSRGPFFWIKAARAPFFTGSAAPLLVGTAAAYWNLGRIDLVRAALALLALTLLHAGANLANDYYDHLSGADAANISFLRPFTGGSRLIQRNLVLPHEIYQASLISLTLGSLLGLYLVWLIGWPLLLLGASGLLTGFFYSAPPLKLGSRGFGEFVVFLDFGFLPVLGSYYVQAQSFHLLAVLVSLPVGLLMANVLWINQFQDMEADAGVGKLTGVVRLGRRRSSRLHIGLYGATYVSLALGLLFNALPLWSSLAFLSLPLALKGAACAARNYDRLERLAPANAAAVQVHITTSLGLALGFIVSRLQGLV